MGANHGSLPARAAVAVGTLMALAGCSPATTADALETGSPPAMSASPVADASSPPAAEPSFADANGYWCIPDEGTQVQFGCVVVDLPTVVFEDYADAVQYVFTDLEADPRAYGVDDYAFPANSGDCWAGKIDHYPLTINVTFRYCPAGAADPGEYMAECAPMEIPDYTDRDRLWITEGLCEIPPYLRSAEPENPPGDDEASLVDVDGRWCPTSPEQFGEECVEVVLPMVGPPDGAYVYVGAIDDPRGLAAADYAVPADMGECWAGTASSYPPQGGTSFWYCPAGALSGQEFIDDPEEFALVMGTGAEFPDHRDEDRLYLAQDMWPYPYIRDQG
ncbi:hypothetical protein [Demequina iriomotensis]|uniref:hypothetical protein n=1 Tax=Demequina iriomotensis TaxID=1536641 RepID=UPI0007828857|nr:hypothetical protein [Demequina iriomotensis]